MGTIHDVVEQVPRWMLPTVIVAVIGLGIWNQNNNTRFHEVESRLSIQEERVLHVATTAATKDDIALLIETRRLLVQDFDRRATMIQLNLERIEKHLSELNDKLARLKIEERLLERPSVR